MNTPLYYITQAGFALLTILYAAFFVREIKTGAALAGWAPPRINRFMTTLLVTVLIWVAFVSLWSLSGKMSDFSIFPFNLMPVIVIPVIALVVLLNSGRMAEALAHVPAANIIRLQSFRVFVEVLLWMLFIQNLLPVQMTFEGRNLDILAGLSAPVVAALAMKGKISKAGIVIWNIVCLGLLLNIVVTAILSTPSPWRIFMNEPANYIVAYFPISWLPGILVPLAYYLHFFSLKQAIQRKTPKPKPMRKTIAALVLLLWMFSCKVKNESTSAAELTSVGSVERLDPALDKLILPSAKVEVLSEGYEWSEGPLWIESEKMLLFSDVPANRVYRWTEEDSVEVYLDPSGYTGEKPWNGNEPGSNGLALNAQGELVLCQHGDKRLAIMDAPLNAPEPAFMTVAGAYQGRKFNSPNDVAIRRNGDYFFTDPPYGMPRNTAQEIPFQGVYKAADGDVTLLVDSITRPNGIAFSPDEQTLLIANSDPKKPVWYAYDVHEGGSLTNGRIFYDARTTEHSGPGLPDGLKVDDEGNVFATGPGGVWIFNKEAKVLGKIRTPVPSANCAFSPDQKTLYITADNYLLRVKMRD